MHPTVRIEIGGRVFISVDTHLFIQPDELEEGSENHFIARNIRVEPKVRIENPLAGDILTRSGRGRLENTALITCAEEIARPTERPKSNAYHNMRR